MLSEKQKEKLKKKVLEGTVSDKTSLQVFNMVSELEEKVETLTKELKEEIEETISEIKESEKIDLDKVLSSVKGNTGDKGETGEQGIQGERGEQGEKGDKGDPGEPGKDGRDGIDGLPGIDGLNGENGLPGADGSPDTRLQIVEKINTGDKKDLKIELKQIEGTEKMEAGIIDRAVSILDQRTKFLINKGVKHDSTLSGSGTDADPLTVIGGGGGTWGSITGTLSDQTDLQTELNTKANTSGALTQFVGNGNWKVWYSDGSGDVQELALGASGTFLKSNGASSIPSFDTPAGSGDVTAAANIADNRIVRGDGGAKGIQQSGITIDDSNNISGVVAITASGGYVGTVAGVAQTLTNSDDNASVQVALLQGDRSTYADNDEAYITMRLSDDLDAQTEVARQTWVATDVSSGTMDAQLEWDVIVNGVLTNVAKLTGTGLSLSTIELGGVSTTDTTLSRHSAGQLSVEGVQVATASNSLTLTGKTLTAPRISSGSFIGDINGDAIFEVSTGHGGVVNWFLADNGATGVNPRLEAKGETNVGIDLQAKGTGVYRLLGTADTAAELRLYEDTTDGTNYSAFKVGTQAASITYTLPTAVGGAGTFLKDVAGDGVLSWATPAGSGDVSKVGTPVNNQMAVWTGDGTLEGTSDFTYDGTSLNLITGKNFQIAGATILADAAGTTTLSNIDALDATTEATIEAAIDTLANLTTIQGRTVTLADAGANAIFGWDDVAGAYENLTAAEATATLNVFGADVGAGGVKGLVPATVAGDSAKYLKGDGTWAAVAGGGATTALDNLAAVAINTTLVSDTDNTDALGTTAIAWSDLFLGSGAVIQFNSAPSTSDVTLTHSANTLTLAGGTLALGSESLTMTGSIAATGARVTKVWTADLESTNMPTVGGTAILTSLTAPTFTTIELGAAATDTTLSRVSAGVVAIEGVNILTTATGLALSGGTMTGNITLGENAGIVHDSALSADGKYTGDVIAGTAGATLAFGDLIYLDPTDSRWELADANAALGADGDPRGILGICVLAAAADASATTILLWGMVRADTAFPTFTVNAPVYVSETAGDVTGTEPTTTDAAIRKIGFGFDANTLYFCPDNIYITHT